ncbi:MAG: alginate export family protein [Nibricoccus sp.]
MRKFRNSLVALLVAVTTASAQEKKADAAPTSQPATPPAAFAFGGDVRLRYEAYDGVHTLNCDAPFHDRDYFRLRTRVWANYNIVPTFSVYGRVAAEPRYWFNNSTVAGEGKEWKYAILDNLYAKWSTNLPGKLPVTVTAGRQDIQLGDQWLVSDGSPCDGSWTNYFDGLRATLEVPAIKTKFDVISFKQQAHPKDQFPILGRQGSYVLTDQDEFGAIVYATNKSIKNLQIEGYAIYKEDIRAVSTSNDGAVSTVGARVAGTPAPKWLYSVEAAWQWGRRDLPIRFPLSSTGKRDVEAYGWNAKLTYSFKDKLANQITLLTEYLSGDDPDTADTDEMFDVLWGRYPRLGETWNVTYAVETSGRTGQYQNLMKYGVQWAISPTKTTSLSTMYCALFAPQEVPTRSTNNTRFSRTGNFRGHQVQVIAKQKITKELSALVLAEVAFLGDFYTQRDTVTFYRAELMYTF